MANPVESTSTISEGGGVYPYIHGPVAGFLSKHFPNANTLRLDTVVQHTIRAAPPIPDFLDWFPSLTTTQATAVADALHRGPSRSWHVCHQSPDQSPPSKATPSKSAGLLLTPSTTTTPSAEGARPRWPDVLAIGQFNQGDDDPVDYRAGFLSLCRTARKVFRSQPTRPFLHAFYIWQSRAEFWNFDHAGMYCSDELDVRSDFGTIISVLLSFRLMTDKKLGMSTMVKLDEAGRSYIEVDAEIVASHQDWKSNKLFLDDQPIAMSGWPFGRSMACYRARLPGSAEYREREYVVKFTWEVWWRHREPKLLRVAKDKKVWGLVSLNFYQEGEDTTADLRAGLRFGPLQRLRPSGLSRAAVSSSSSSRSNGVLAHTEETGRLFRNLLLSCAVLSPFGRPLHTFKTRLELLQVFRDAIKAHRSLLQDGGILHRDISAGNIIITDATAEDAPKAILIDLDRARDLQSEEEDGLGAVGTTVSAAIEVLREAEGMEQTYRHDLESFFYVFLRTVVANRARDLPPSSRLRRWGQGTWREGAEVKMADMGDGERFCGILQEFPAEFRSLTPLTETVRRILFQPEEGKIWTGTPPAGAADEMYDGMISAFEEAITVEEAALGT
jgi:hypothetical protein